jgi:tetratricopeptide (TPR) repeat protein
MASVLTRLALPVILLPPVVEIAFGLMNRARRQTLLTRATRGAVIGTVLGGTVTLTLSMAALFSQFPNVAGTANVPSTTAPKLGPLADLSKAAMKPGDDPFQALVTGQEKLVHENPNNNELAVVLGSFYKTQATLAREQGNSEKAVAVYDKAIATLQAAVQKEPRHSKAREELRNCHSGRAETLARLDRSAEALAEWDRALALDTWPDRSEYRLQRALTLARLGEYAKAMTDCDDLARGKDLPAATLYTLGRAYARAAGAIPDQGARAAAADRAMALLKQAVAAGYNAALIKQEKDLDALRDRDDFKELVAALEVRKAKEKK